MKIRKKYAPARVDDAQKMLADYAMVLDIAGQLAGLATEREQIDRFFELFTLICRPKNMFYLAMADDGTTNLFSQPATDSPDTATRRLLRLSGDHALTGSGAGFTFRIKDQQQTLAIFELDGVAEPENINHYVNLALNIQSILALAVTNSRIYQSLEEARNVLEDERDRAQSYLDIVGVMMLVLDRKGIVTRINPAGCAILGKQENEILGRQWFDSFVPHREREQVRSAYRQLMDGNIELVRYYENSVLASNGQEKIIAWHNTLVRDDQGEIVGSLSSGADITDRRRDENLSAALNEINTAISGTLQLDEIMRLVVMKAARGVGCETASIIMLENDEWVVRYADGLPEKFLGLRIPRDSAPHLEDAVQQRRARIVPDYEGPRPAGPLRDHGVRSFLVAPLLTRQEIQGVLTLNYHSPQARFTDSQVDFAGQLAAAVSLHIENARMFRKELDSRAQIQSYATQLSLLHKIGLSLNRETDQDKLLLTVLAGAAGLTDAGVGAMIISREGKPDLVSMHYASWYQQKCEIKGDLVRFHEKLNRMVDGGHVDATRIAAARLSDAVFEFPAGHPHIRGLLIGTLTDTRGQIVGHFLLSDKGNGADFSRQDEEIIGLLAAQASVALVSALNFEREYLVADALQTALLPRAPIRDDLDVALLYRAAGQTRIGGDFYELVELGGSQVAVAVGDVCGKGLQAATYNAMMKYMLRAFLSEGLDPGACLARLNAAVNEELPMEKFVTMGLAIIDTGTGKLFYSAAGHPHPVLLSGAVCEELDMPPTLPLGVLEEFSFPVVEYSMSSDGAILMYTDGIFEARSAAGEQFGQARLLSAIADLAGLPASQVVNGLLDRVMDFAQGNLKDDVALLMARLQP